MLLVVGANICRKDHLSQPGLHRLFFSGIVFSFVVKEEDRLLLIFIVPKAGFKMPCLHSKQSAEGWECGEACNRGPWVQWGERLPELWSSNEDRQGSLGRKQRGDILSSFN